MTLVPNQGELFDMLTNSVITIEHFENFNYKLARFTGFDTVTYLLLDKY